MLLWIELALTIIASAIGFGYPAFGSHQFALIEGFVRRFADKRGLAVISIGFLTIILRLALLPVSPVPKPVFHDDFCYLLAADTFSHGRLTNPTHPMWVHFETFGIMQEPTYQCIAQPGQGLILAFGEHVLGHPFWGILISIALMCSAITWMLQGWMPPQWAVLGGALAILRLGVYSYWANSYWGGALGATGGALVLGALPRIVKSQAPRDAIVLSIGLAILANTRPYEGLILSLTVAGALIIWMFDKKRPPLQTSLCCVVLPIACCMVLTSSAMAYYNWRLTGSPLRTGYQVEERTYSVSPYFIWQPLRSEPIFHHELMRDMYVNRQPKLYHISRSGLGPFVKIWRIWAFYVGPVLTIPVLLAIFTLPVGLHWSAINRKTKFLLLALSLALVSFGFEVFFEAHYAAPITSLVLAVVLLSMQQIKDWRIHNRPIGLVLIKSVPIVCIIVFFLRAAAAPLHISLPHAHDPAWFEFLPQAQGRPTILAQLERLPGSHLVMVRYNNNRIPFEEWVYNDADIDNSKVVWAREMNVEANKELIGYFKNRQTWLVDADEKPPRLIPYQELECCSDCNLKQGNTMITHRCKCPC